MDPLSKVELMPRMENRQMVMGADAKLGGCLSRSSAKCREGAGASATRRSKSRPMAVEFVWDRGGANAIASLPAVRVPPRRSRPGVPFLSGRAHAGSC